MQAGTIGVPRRSCFRPSAADWGLAAVIFLMLAPISRASVAAAPVVAAAPGKGVVAVALAAVQESPPIERRFRQTVRDIYRSLRRTLKRSSYFVQSSPRWWGRRLKRAFWPIIFAFGALFLDSGLLDAWRRDGLRVLRSYVPMMLYVYGKLFFSSGGGWIAKLGVLAALFYGLWRDDLLRDGRWIALSFNRLDDLIVIAVAVRGFVASCPDELVQRYAGQAIDIRNRIRPRRDSTDQSSGGE